jgi:hypothetical protein
VITGGRQEGGEAADSKDSHRIKAVGSFSRGCRERRIIMKKQAYTVIAMMVLIGSVVVAAQAQSSGRTHLRVNIPFQFNVGNKLMPAGEYVVRSVSYDSSNVVLKIENRDGEAKAMLMTRTIDGKAQNSAKLIFNRYGSQYFFGQLWVDGDGDGLQAPKCRAERAAQREFAALKVAIETVAATARR